MQRDISHFAAGKLQGGWSSADFAKYFTKENLRTLVSRFDKLEPLVRVRILLAVLSLEDTAREVLQAELQSLVAVAKDDKDEWVNITARAVSGFSGPLDLQAVVQGSACVQKTVTDLERLTETGDGSSFRPLEEAYLDTSLLASPRGVESMPEHNHFVPRDGGAGSLPELTRRASASAAAALTAAQRVRDAPGSPRPAQLRPLDPGGAAGDSTSSAVAAGLQSISRPAAGVEDMFRSSRPTLSSTSRQMVNSSLAQHSDRRGDARPRNIKLLGVDEVKKLSRHVAAPSPEYSSSLANGHARIEEEDEEPEEGELPADDLLAGGSGELNAHHRKRQRILNERVITS